MVEERGRGEGEREGKSEREVELVDGWGGDELGVSWIGELGAWEWVREREKQVSELKKENRLWGKDRMGEGKGETVINK